MPPGSSACRISPWFITTMWSASAIASFWSCVTNTVVVRSRSCRLAQLHAHQLAELGVEGAERLVHQEGLRLAHDRATQRDALPVAAREAAHARAQQVLDAQDGGHVADAPLDLVARQAFVAQRELEVAAHAHVRVEREELEHHRDVALARSLVGHVLAGQRDGAGGRDTPGPRACAAWWSCRSPRGPAAPRTGRRPASASSCARRRSR